MRICLLSYDIVGPIRNGGIGTAFTALAEQLTADGHDVTLAFASDHTETAPLAAWVDDYAARGMRLEPLYLSGTEAFQSLQAFRWLAAQDFDVVHFHEWRGLGFFAAVARHCGLALTRTALVCQLHSPTTWHRLHSSSFASDPRDAQVAFMEQRSAELADLVFSPSRYLLDWVKAEGWKLPAAQAIHPNLLPRDFGCHAGGMEARPVRELVFFGRLEERKGLDLFCKAVSALVQQGVRPAQVTFLGKVGEIAGESALRMIARSAAGWGLRWCVRNELDVTGARDYLAQPGRLAVIASVMENSPYTVLECIAAGTPFLAADVGGVAELVEAADRPNLLFPREVAALAERLAQVLAGGARPARPALDWQRNIEQWREMQARAAAAAILPEPPTHRPLVSVCVSTFNRPVLLAEALASLEAQTYEAIEVVVVDDASTDPAARVFLDAVAPRLAARGWRLIRQARNAYLGAARNTAAAAARGEFLLFMDDDNIATPRMVERYVTAALASRAEILTCQLHGFVGEGPGPAGDAALPNGWIPLGGPTALGMLENCFGDAGFLIRRNSFEALGGFSTDRAGFEDWELLLRASLAGREILCVPEVLYHYRIDRGSMLRGMTSSEAFRSHARVMRVWGEAAATPALRAALRLALEIMVAPRYATGASLDGAALNGAPAFRALAAELLAQGDAAAAGRLLEHACRLQPADAATSVEAEALAESFLLAELPTP